MSFKPVKRIINEPDLYIHRRKDVCRAKRNPFLPISGSSNTAMKIVVLRHLAEVFHGNFYSLGYKLHINNFTNFIFQKFIFTVLTKMIFISLILHFLNFHRKKNKNKKMYNIVQFQEYKLVIV